MNDLRSKYLFIVQANQQKNYFADVLRVLFEPAMRDGQKVEKDLHASLYAAVHPEIVN